jgi:ABC-type polysaccharide transport system permease subunit
MASLSTRTVVNGGIAFPAPLALALVLNGIMNTHVKRAMQSIVYLPHFLPWVIVIALWQQVFGGAGFFSQMLRYQGADSLDIMANPDIFKPLVVLESIWKEMGWGTVIFLAALCGFRVASRRGRHIRTSTACTRLAMVCRAAPSATSPPWSV